MNGTQPFTGLFFLGLFAMAIPAARATDAPTLEQAAAEYTTVARPLLAKFCLECHSTEVMEGTLDLERFAALGDVRKATTVWLKVAEMLDNGEMPPKAARRLPARERQTLRAWLTRYLKAEAFANAGDPGPVVLRRLSNAQYTDTLRDLTGVPLDPAREFPVDGAAGEGFTNAGNALVMSPALLTKYFDAAKGVAAHAVPLSDGLRFSPGTTRRDWTDEALQHIRGFYSEFTDPGGGTQVNLQGIVFGTNTGGRLPLEHYLAATLAERDALAKGTKTVEAVARADAEPEVPRLALVGPERDRLLHAARRRSRAMESGHARRRAGDRPGHRPLAVGVVEVQQRGAYRQGRRSEVVDGASLALAHAAGVPAATPHTSGREGCDAVPRRRRGGRRVGARPGRLGATPPGRARHARDVAPRRAEVLAGAGGASRASLRRDREEPRGGRRGGRSAGPVRPGETCPEARRAARRARGLVRLPRTGHGRRLRGDHRAPPGQDRERVGLRLRERLGPRDVAGDPGQRVRHARPHPGQSQAAQRGDAPVAHLARGGRLAQPGIGRVACKRERCSTPTPSAATA